MHRDLLWIDSRAGLAVGAGVLALNGWLSAFLGLPRDLLWGTGAANLLYGSYSAWLFSRPRRPPVAITGLVIANACCACVCFALAYHFAPTATAFGLIHLAGEGLIVGTLAALEWRARVALALGRPR